MSKDTLIDKCTACSDAGGYCPEHAPKREDTLIQEMKALQGIVTSNFWNMAIERCVEIVKRHALSEIPVISAEDIEIAARAITTVRYRKYEQENSQCESEYVFYLWHKWADEAAAVVSAMRPELRPPVRESGAVSSIDYQQRKGAPLDFYTSVAANAYAAAATRDDVSHFDAMKTALNAVEEAKSNSIEGDKT